MIRVLLLVLASVSATWAQMGADETAALLEEAHAAYRDGEAAMSINPVAAREDYLRAARRYDRVIREGGAANDAVYFDLANSLLGARDYGRAILNYRRALLFDPNNAAVLNNLSIARNQRAEEYNLAILTDGAGGSGLALRPWLSGGFAAAWTALWGLLAVGLFRPEKIRRGWLVGASVATVLLMSGTLAAAVQFGQTHGVTTASSSIPRVGAGLEHGRALMGPVMPGEEFRLLDTVNEWAEVRFSSGETAWLSVADFEVIEAVD